MTKEAIANGLGDIPSRDVSKLNQFFRNGMVAFFLQRKLLNERLAKNMLVWPFFKEKWSLQAGEGIRWILSTALRSSIPT